MVRTTTTAASPSLMRRLNTLAVLNSIRDRGPISRPGLVRETGLSAPTIGEVVALLLLQGYIDEFDSRPNRGPKRPGPRAKLLGFRATLGYVIGIDTGADNSAAKLADLSGTVVAEVRIPHTQPARSAEVLTTIRAATAQVLELASVSASNLLAITIGTPGVVDPVTGTISLAPQITGWDGLELATELSDLADCPIIIENETHLSLLAERWMGGARDLDNVVLVQLGIGIGGAILMGGDVLRGSNGAAGEIAYLVTGGEDEDLPPESSVGAFEWFAGGHAYRRHGIRVATTEAGALLLELAGGNPDAVTARIVFDAAARDDPAALEITSMLLGRLGRGIASIATTLNPELILIGGGITNAGASLLPPIREVIERLTPYPPSIALSTLGADGPALGAVRRALEVAEENTFTFLNSQPNR